MSTAFSDGVVSANGYSLYVAPAMVVAADWADPTFQSPPYSLSVDVRTTSSNDMAVTLVVRACVAWGTRLAWLLQASPRRRDP